MPGIAKMPDAPQPAPVELQLPGEFPAFPDDVLERFPSLQQWKTAVDQWYGQVVQVLTDANQAQSNQINLSTAQLAALQTQVDNTAPGAFVAAGGLVAVGTVVIVDDTGAEHTAMVSS